MRARAPVLCLAALVLAGCGKTEKSGSVGDELTADGVEVTVQRVDRSVPVPRSDVSGLSTPARGSKLVGVLARACSDHGGAIGPYSFGVESSEGKGRLKFPARNYRRAFDTVRDGCGGGWVVFEIPRGSRLEKVTFGFEDTGTAMRPQDEVDAEFTWEVE